jgi:aspartyl-tRNA(Asn)/glutamyl-tRNA(Gln) amidotransferase subunit A
MVNFPSTITKVVEGIRAGDFSAQEIHDHYTAKIRREDDAFHAYLSVFDSQALRDITTALPLAGVPCAIKDNILIEDSVATAGSKILEKYVSAFDATVTKQLCAGGATFLGKTNMDEFAMGSSTENSAFGATKNPHDVSRVPGGSSGGSAAAVAADLAVFALGSDTGGSIRQPASFCGVVGLKPTYGRVSRHGLMAMASSLDQIGPITKTVEDAALVLNAIAGWDAHDATTARSDAPDFTHHLRDSVAGLRIGIPREYFGHGLDGEVDERVREMIQKLESRGAHIVDVSLPHSEYALAVYYIVMPCEVSANLARFDGIRYGHSTSKAASLLEVYAKSRDEGFGAEPKRRIMLGTYALSSGYYDAYYLKAQKVRALIKKDFDNAFQNVDVLVGPTSPSVAFALGEKSADPLAMYLADIYTVPANLAGLPAISVPCGKGNQSTMPVGLHIIGKQFDESMVLRVAQAVEDESL